MFNSLSINELNALEQKLYDWSQRIWRTVGGGTYHREMADLQDEALTILVAKEHEYAMCS